MLWHIVRFRFAGDVEDGERVAFEDSLRGLAGRIDDLRLLRVARAVDEPDVTGLITGFADEAGLGNYRDHPAHVPVVARARELCAEITRLDVATADPPDALPRTV